ncbi:hypothetical protein [uncultured Winogradskyella sp.]|uniref:toxin-antitoxin system YwqK family antitoxin n=1 Tax=uncultured Winogradskyella sp. TaxID=395353 RepID=UPI0026271B51|nr:hypothetical protein [uncultured Winogradskyella sp.]
MRLLFIFCLICSFATAQKHYQKNYFDNGNIKSAGWIENGKKVKYWRTYYENGNLKSEGHFKNNVRTKFWKLYSSNGVKESEGHFKNGKKIKWWVFYDRNGKVNHKCQLSNNKKNGYCLMYKDEELTSAAKYSLGKKIKEWTDLKSFKKENKLSDLY